MENFYNLYFQNQDDYTSEIAIVNNNYLENIYKKGFRSNDKEKIFLENSDNNIQNIQTNKYNYCYIKIINDNINPLLYQILKSNLGYNYVYPFYIFIFYSLLLYFLKIYYLLL